MAKFEFRLWLMRDAPKSQTRLDHCCEPLTDFHTGPISKDVESDESFVVSCMAVATTVSAPGSSAPLSGMVEH
jgi:hypothetical protein